MPSTSSRAIQLMYWVPGPTTPPSPALKGSSIFPRAPPAGLRTTPKRGWTTRMPALRAGSAAASHSTDRRPRKSSAGASFSVTQASPRFP